MSANGISVYLYLYDLLTGKRGQREIRFVFVDEVQDYDAFQLAYLKFCFPKARFTLLGDLNQAICNSWARCLNRKRPRSFS